MPRDFITHVARRIAVVESLLALATGSLVGILTYAGASVLRMPTRWMLFAGILAGVVAAVLTWRASRPRRGPAAAARAIERIAPAGNLIVTLEELHRHPDRAPEWIRQRVHEKAADHLRRMDVSRVAPLRRAQIAAAITFVAVVSAILLVSTSREIRQPSTLQPASRDRISAGAPGRVRVTIHPPGYTGRPSVTLDDPSRLEVLEGSTIHFERTAASRVRFGEQAIAGAFTARQPGYFVLEDPGGRRFVPLIVLADAAPRVVVADPGKDLLLPAGGRTIPLRFSAADDLALEALELRYTKVSGTGEQFEFQEGTLAVDVERLSAQEWRGRGQLSITDLHLEAGDSLVYRVVARDKRPGGEGLGSSDTYLVAIAGPGQVAFEGIDMPPDMERYALSQQMIVLKLERLRERERTLPSATVAEEAANIAAEQRAVRANFIFLMGGHVEDEEIEAEQSHEIQEGRLENTARRDINTAIGHMTRVEQGLAGANIRSALPPARLAVEALQRAFGRSRYLLRSLAVRSRLDMSRRLVGDTARARGWKRLREDHETSVTIGPRELFNQLLDAGNAAHRGEGIHPARWEALAESALRIDPASKFWQDTARSLLDLQQRDPASVARDLERILAAVSPHARRESLPRSLISTRPPLARAWGLERR